VLFVVMPLTERDGEVVAGLHAYAAIRPTAHMSGLDFTPASGRVVLNTGAVVTADVLEE
jgi:hypothetical protein